MGILSVHHKTVYHYRQPVRFGEHRLMCRPRDSHDLRLLDTRLIIAPIPEIRWLHDPFGNSIAMATFITPATELVFDSSFRVELFPTPETDVELEAYARRWPFTYSSEDIPDLSRCIERHYPDPQHRLDQWMHTLTGAGGSHDTLELLQRLGHKIKAEFVYVEREEIGTQPPVSTLERGSGSCRDFALLMIEAVRSLGLAARFVSGYLNDETATPDAGGLVGGGATHAWAQVYLPGAGWVDFDPTNATVGGRNLIRVAVARDAAQAAPITGSYFGGAEDFERMEISVTVTPDRATSPQGA